MLSSINPLGERARKQSYWQTTAWYLLGTTIGGAVMGTLGGFVGSLLPSGEWRLLAAVLVAIAGALVDLIGQKPPSIHRQVDEDWLSRYRGWVYGLGFGFQLGFGVVTIVPTAAIYAYIAFAILSGSATDGAVIGLTFGLVRGLAVFRVAGAKDPASLRSIMRRLQDGLGSARLATIVAQTSAAILVLVVMVR